MDWKMELEFDVEDLLEKRKIEGNRIEFKSGWNPDEIYRSVCAFANDYENQGGGYIVVGVEEKDGIAVRPVKGVPEDKIDKIHKEALGYNHKIHPEYFPRIIDEEVDGKYIIVFWVPTSVQRPHKTVEHVTVKEDRYYKTFIRYGSSTIAASPEQERELMLMSTREPFDMWGNEKATLDDISPILLSEHLKATGSKLAKRVKSLGIKNVLEQMQLLTGPPERLRIRNVALMMFCEEPEKFFPYMEVNIVHFPKGRLKDPGNFRELAPIKGAVPQIIRKTMESIQNLAIFEFVHKVKGQMEAERVWSYPYEAVEEALVNAYYHRDYMSYQPVTIEIEPDCIRIFSCPGIDRSVPMDVIREGESFRTRMYRNRRLGDFLKELELSEGQGTGIPTIQEDLKKIGSPKAIFETDEDRRQLCVTIPINPRYKELVDAQLENPNSEGSKSEGGADILPISADKFGETSEKRRRNVGEMSEKRRRNVGEMSEKADEGKINATQIKILNLIKSDSSLSAAKIGEMLSIASRSVERNISKLKDMGILERHGGSRGGYWVIKEENE